EKPSFAFIDSVKHVKTSRENIKETGTTNHNPKTEKQDRNAYTRKGLGYTFTKKACFVCGSFSHLLRDCDFHEKRMAKQAELTKSKNKVTGQRENRPVWNNVQRVNHQNKFVPSVLLTKTGKFSVNAARQNNSSQAASTSTASKVNTARLFDDLHRALKDNIIVDNGCSWHMTGNKAYLTDYQEFKGGSIAFGGRNVRITGKGKIKADRLDFEDVYYVEELKHYNLFSVSQICDKKNKVLFSDTVCLLLSPDFKLPDENQVLLKIPRPHNMYSFNLKNIDPSGDLACLFAKASIDESNKWHRRLGYVNFKNLNRLVKGNLVRGLPSKIFENDHTCAACQKGKQHKASCKAKTVSFMN
nr:ribonuclease H-like domain-containing protein [Tanacetum cinerariifolium]